MRMLFLYRILHIFTAWLYLQTEIKIYFAYFFVTSKSEKAGLALHGMV